MHEKTNKKNYAHGEDSVQSRHQSKKDSKDQESIQSSTIPNGKVTKSQ